SSPAVARPGRRSSRCCWRPASGGCWSGTARASCPRTTSGSPAPRWDVSAGNVLPVEALAGMNERAVVFPTANPTPEVDPVRARQYAAVVASGRSDLPNQINNVLAFPGVFRGLLDARATEITDGMLVAAAEALAAVVRDDQLNANFIIPSVFDAEVTKAV